ncbi:MFS general substrate transporter [Alternaria alternata]|nr:MFS general substrate transporter [Alternaria alternata]
MVEPQRYWECAASPCSFFTMQPELNALKGDDKAVAMSKDVEIQLDNMDGNSLKKEESAMVGEVEDLDEANLFLRQHNITPQYIAELLEDQNANKKVSRKVDFLLLPLLCGTYFLQYIDKQAISYSAVFDLFETTGITGDQYSWLASIFYFAYLFAEWPSAYLAQHFPTGRVVSIYCFCWGSVMLLTAATHNFAGFAAMRFLLGVFESVVTPAFMMMVGMWYVGKQQPARAGMFYCFNGIGSAVGGILFYGCGYAKTFVVWKIIYIICGGMTVLWSILLFFRLPNNIMTAKSFTTEEKALLIARAASNRTGVYNRKIKLQQVLEALIDPQIWILFFFVLCNEMINGGNANFGKLIVKDVAGGDPLKTTLYGIPQGFAQVFWVFTGPFLASRLPNARTFIMALYLCPTIIGTCLIWQLPRSNTAGCLAGYYLVCREHAAASPISS